MKKVARIVIRLPKVAYKLFINYLYDLSRFIKHSGTLDPGGDYETICGRILANYHIIEKGLSLQDTRLKFGKTQISKLLNLLKVYKTRGYPTDEAPYSYAISALISYLEFHKQQGVELNELRKEVSNLKHSSNTTNSCGGTENKQSKFLLEKAKGDFASLCSCRHSIRNFSGRPVAESLIKEAISIAQRTPSVCNRQSFRVYVISDPDTKTKALSHQNGNRGFGDKIDKVLIVTCDLSVFMGAQERNQSFIDGGLFSMSLLYALTYLGIGSCPLNWSAGRQQDSNFRKAFTQIKESENIIMFIGVGHLPDSLEVAKSARFPLEKIVNFL